MKFAILQANVSDAPGLTKIAFAAKRHWNYPDEYFDIWEKELTITTAYILKNPVFKVVKNNQIIGFYSLVKVPKETYFEKIRIQAGWWLEHLFILPAFHHQGIGKKLIKHAGEELTKRGEKTLLIFVDPFATGFYDKIGAQLLYHSPSSIKGRTIPVYQLVFA